MIKIKEKIASLLKLERLLKKKGAVTYCTDMVLSFWFYVGFDGVDVFLVAASTSTV